MTNRWLAARTARLAVTAAALALTAGVGAQTVPDTEVPDATGLKFPTNLQIFGKLDPNIRKPTAIVNDTVITGTDVDQRVALIVAANNIDLSADDRAKLKLQVLRQLIDETLQIQEARARDISVTSDEITESYNRVAQNFNRTPAEFSRYLREKGSSDRSLKRQIEGELVWQRYLHRKVDINVGEAEVAAILKRLEDAKGTDEYHLREIYIKGDGDRAPQALSSAQQVMEQIKTGKAPFEYYARNFSDSTTKVQGGDLDWVRPATLPDELAKTAEAMQIGQVAGPIETPGGYSILYLVDKRQVLTADPRDAKLSLKQLTVHFPEGTTQAQANERAAQFAKLTQSIQGCGAVEKSAATIGAEVVNNDTIRIRDLPGPLQAIILKMQVGQASPPFGSPEEGVRSLVLCGRDDPTSGTLPNPQAVQGQLEQQRVNLRAQQLLRDLRRDAIVEYR